MKYDNEIPRSNFIIRNWGQRVPRVPVTFHARSLVSVKPLWWTAFFCFLRWNVFSIERFHSRGQHLCKFTATKKNVCIRKEFNSHRIVLVHQHDRRDVMWKRSIYNQGGLKGRVVMLLYTLSWNVLTVFWLVRHFKKLIAASAGFVE